MPESTYLQSPPPWGTYAPRLREQRLILSLVRAGLSRGSLRHGLQKRWIRKFGSVVDVERRGVRYRLDLSNNVTDSKILLSSAFYDQVEIEAICAGSRGVFVDVGATRSWGFARKTASMPGLHTLRCRSSWHRFPECRSLPASSPAVLTPKVWAVCSEGRGLKFELTQNRPQNRKSPGFRHPRTSEQS